MCVDGSTTVEINLQISVVPFHLSLRFLLENENIANRKIDYVSVARFCGSLQQVTQSRPPGTVFKTCFFFNTLNLGLLPPASEGWGR